MHVIVKTIIHGIKLQKFVNLIVFQYLIHLVFLNQINNVNVRKDFNGIKLLNNVFVKSIVNLSMTHVYALIIIFKIKLENAFQTAQKLKIQMALYLHNNNVNVMMDIILHKLIKESGVN